MLAIQFDPTISLGSILSATMTIIGMAAMVLVTLSKIRTKIELMIDELQRGHRQLADRMEHHEENDQKMFHELQEKITKVVGDLQRVIGQADIVFRNSSRLPPSGL